MNNLMWTKKYLFILLIVSSVQLSAMNLNKDVAFYNEYNSLAIRIQEQRQWCIKSLEDQGNSLNEDLQLFEKVKLFDTGKKKLTYVQGVFSVKSYDLLQNHITQKYDKHANILIQLEKKIEDRQLKFNEIESIVKQCEKKLNMLKSQNNQRQEQERRGQKRKLSDQRENNIILKKKKNI